MGFARYFDRNLQAAAALLKTVDDAQFRALVANELICIAFDQAAVGTSEGQDALDLLVRITARLYPNLAIAALDAASSRYASKLVKVAKAVNPNISLERDCERATRALVVGDSVFPRRRRCKLVLYVGSSDWTAALSQHGPVGSHNTKNPFGAGVAACIAGANLFRSVFATQLGAPALDAEVRFSVWSLSTEDAASPSIGLLKGSSIGEVHIAGVGAIGNGIVWAMSRMACSGTVHLIDSERLDATNLQRYVLAVDEDEGRSKVQLAAEVLGRSKRARIMAVPHDSTWELYATASKDRRFDVAISALDSASARMRLQASLPRKVLNGWTQAGEAGVSRHLFSDSFACLACLYLPRSRKPNLDQLILQGLGIGEDAALLKEVRRRLQQQSPCDGNFLMEVSAKSGLSPDRLLPFEGKTVQSLYQGVVCSGATLDFKGVEAVATAEVPMPFQSALSGILLAAELIPGRPALPTITQIDLLRPMPNMPSHFRKNEGRGKCLCEDGDFKRAYAEKYPA